MPFGTPIDWTAPIVCDNCHKTIQRASIARHNKKGCLHWRTFSQAYLNSQKINKD